MDLIYLLTSRDGRINRAKYWIGAVVLTLASMLGTGLAVAAFGVSDTSVRLTVLIAFLLVYPTYALMAKRFQDRDKPGWTALYALVPIYGINFMQTFGSIGKAEPGMVSTLLDLVIVGLSLWLLIELGILKGTQGPNRFGPDPLGQAKPDAVL
jgi:uncharacterized membrane protein YhaH (DUF805 family)